MRSLLLILRNLRRNRLRSVLTVLAIVLLVALSSMLFTVLRFLGLATTAQAKDVKTVITERYRIPSRFDRAYMEQIVSPSSTVGRELEKIPGFDRTMHNVWHFVAFTTDVEKKNPNLGFFVIATYPEKIPTMIDSMAGLDPSLPAKMKKPPNSGLPGIGVIMGPERLAKLGKKVGDVFPATSLSHRAGTRGRPPIEMQFEIVGTLPEGTRWTNGAFMDYEYLDRVLKDKQSELDGKVNLGWLQVTDQESAKAVGIAIETTIRDLKNEVATVAVGRFLESAKDLLNLMRYVLAPAIGVVMVLIVAIAISITVRERSKEIAVLKVLGFTRPRILTLVLGEGVLLGLVAGLVGAAGTYFLFNRVLGGINLRIAFFDVFFVPSHVFWWGPGLGAFAAVLGSILPAWSAQRIKVSEVFAKVA